MLLKIIIAVLTFGAALLKGFEKIFNKERSASIYDYLLFFFLLAIGGVTSYEIWEENDKVVEASRLKREQEISDRDTLNARIRLGIDSGVNSNNDAIAKAFSKQHIDFDSLKVAIKVIRDSAKRVINNFNQDDPFLSIDTNGIFQDKRDGPNYHHYIMLSSHEAGSTNFNLKMYFIYQYPNGLREYVAQKSFLTYDSKIPKNGGKRVGLNSFSNKQIVNIYIYMTGTYSTLDRQKSYPIDEVFIYFSNNNHTAIASPDLKASIIKLIPEKMISL